jgi:hypothetical protein
MFRNGAVGTVESRASLEGAVELGELFAMPTLLSMPFLYGFLLFVNMSALLVRVSETR